MKTNISVEMQLETVQCYSCSIHFAMPVYFKARRKEDRETFYCPNGHGQHYTGKPRAEVAEEELAATKKRLEAALSRENELKALQKKQEKRIANGVCPCCKRTFKQLAAHMKYKHPDYK